MRARRSCPTSRYWRAEAARASADRAVQLLVRGIRVVERLRLSRRLRQSEIPLAARILRVADSYAAMT